MSRIPLHYKKSLSTGFFLSLLNLTIETQGGLHVSASLIFACKFFFRETVLLMKIMGFKDKPTMMHSRLFPMLPRFFTSQFSQGSRLLLK